MNTLRSVSFPFVLGLAVLQLWGAGKESQGSGQASAARLRWESARRTTHAARTLLLQRLDMIAEADTCRQSLSSQSINLAHVRQTLRRVRFYDAHGPEGALKFGQVVGKPASPDQPLRELARGLPADAFVLGYHDGAAYVRTHQVVLNRGFLWQAGPDSSAERPTTDEEKQALLLHELLHIALNQNDDDLTRQDLCPLRLLAFCPAQPRT